ncbi:hypothetical protein PQO03_14455 [Lentisphaera profundi]|uniref:6-bladed beta-propeller n=1 Tax=Lentisphaera profundi TaxID=1658616 RepID=A0ABY7VXS2_9BACT|nr:hypothetical protein [Lentisphaera profundi]WDE99035.1 hypothetical protein PQO03_14455 [Lentisphaera profundi]
MKKTALLTLFALCASTYAHDDHSHKINPVALSQAPFTDADFVTGQNNFKYKVDLAWGETPTGKANLGATHGGVAVDKAGNVYVSTNEKDGIVKLCGDGHFIKGFGPETHSSHSLELKEENGKEYIYAAFNSQKKVCKMDLDGKIIWTINGFPDHPAYKKAKPRYAPTAVDVAPDGRIYVSDGYATSLIHVYSADQKYLTTFGGRGKGEGTFSTSHGLTIDTRGDQPYIIVSDRENRALQRLTLDGKYVDTPIKDLRRPCAISIMGDNIAVAELSGRCVILDKDFKIVSILGDNPNKKEHHSYKVDPKDWKPAIFTAPHGCSFDKDLNLYVQDWNFKGRLRKLSLQK